MTQLLAKTRMGLQIDFVLIVIFGNVAREARPAKQLLDGQILEIAISVLIDFIRKRQ